MISPWHKVYIDTNLTDRQYKQQSALLHRLRHWCECNLSSYGHLWKHEDSSNWIFLFATAQDATMFKLANGV